MCLHNRSRRRPEKSSKDSSVRASKAAFRLIGPVLSFSPVFFPLKERGLPLCADGRRGQE